MTPPDDEVIEQLRGRLGDAAILADMDAIYADIEAELAARHAYCDSSGRCCRFAEFGHCLFVTTPELIHFLSRYNAQPPTTDSPLARGMLTNLDMSPAEYCPLQMGRLCGVHAFRPMGCRLYFCAPGSETWGRELYEKFHARLKSLCEKHCLPYAYTEWTSTLARLIRMGLVSPVGTSG